jgi:hypothetical protein
MKASGQAIADEKSNDALIIAEAGTDAPQLDPANPDASQMQPDAIHIQIGADTRGYFRVGKMELPPARRIGHICHPLQNAPHRKKGSSPPDVRNQPP